MPKMNRDIDPPPESPTQEDLGFKIALRNELLVRITQQGSSLEAVFPPGGPQREEPGQATLVVPALPSTRAPRATASQHQIASFAGASKIFTVSTGDRKKEPQISSERSCTWGISKLGSPMQWLSQV
jgi:hypothetical protein